MSLQVPALPVELWRQVLSHLMNSLRCRTQASYSPPAPLISLLEVRATCQLFKTLMDELLENMSMPLETDIQRNFMQFNPEARLSNLKHTSLPQLEAPEAPEKKLRPLPNLEVPHLPASGFQGTSILLYGPLGCLEIALIARLAKDLKDFNGAIFTLDLYKLGINDGDGFMLGLEW